MKPPISPILFSLLLFLGMLGALWIGRRLAARHKPDGTGSEADPLDTIETAVFALFGLLIAFTFSGAAGRFQEKRMLVAEEANAIGTAYLRVDLAVPDAQPGLREKMRRYLDSRLETYRLLPDIRAAQAEMVRSQQLQSEIWAAAVEATREPNAAPFAALLLLPALNTMIDITTTRTLSLQNHPPGIIYWLLFALGVLCSLLAGYRMKRRLRRSWLHLVGFSLVTVIVVYVTLDVEYPRIGVIRLAGADQTLVDLRESMK